jgi:serine/threonine-protein kinase
VLVGTPVNLVVSAGDVAAIVPQIVGLTQTDAEAAITAAGLVVGTVIDQISTSSPPGTVLNQSPDAGTSVALGTGVNFTVSIGGGTVAVPALVGLQQAAAETAIVAAGLVVGPATTLPSPIIPAGEVIAQTPAAGTVVTLGTRVNLTVSSGQGFVLVPNLIGMSQTAAAVALTAARLNLGTVTLRSSPTEPAGTVLSQSPVSGSAVQVGSAVNVVVSSGLTQTPVPNVIGMTLVAAQQAILAAGLSVGTVQQQTNPAVPAGQVFQQSPAPGTLVGPGASVNLVSKHFNYKT